MSKLGIYLVGARGNIGALAITGLLAMQEGLAPKTGMVSALPEFANAGLPSIKDMVVGGCDVSEVNLADRTAQLAHPGRMLAPALAAKLRGLLLVKNESIDTIPTLQSGARPATLATEYAAKLAKFRLAHQLERVVVLFVASTEATPPTTAWHNDAAAFEAHINTGDSAEGFTHAMLWAHAAFNSGCGFVNFTPTPGSEIPALSQIALENGCVHAGRDGKTGETLLKTVLGPMFVQRNLKVRSWLANNYLGNNDGAVLADDGARATKIASKDEALHSILGERAHLSTDIGYAPSLGDWKTAMDFIHFEGFLGTGMTLQFTWQGCDSALAAPLVLDLARFTGWAMEQGESGPLGWLAAFFKSPMGSDTHGFAEQMHALFGRVSVGG